MATHTKQIHYSSNPSNLLISKLPLFPALIVPVWNRYSSTQSAPVPSLLVPSLSFLFWDEVSNVALESFVITLTQLCNTHQHSPHPSSPCPLFRVYGITFQ